MNYCHTHYVFKLIHDGKWICRRCDLKPDAKMKKYKDLTAEELEAYQSHPTPEFWAAKSDHFEALEKAEAERIEAAKPPPAPLTIEELTVQMRKLQERLKDLEEKVARGPDPRHWSGT